MTLLARPTHKARGQPSSAGDRRLAFVDGARALAAIYVLLTHCWAFAFDLDRGYPANGGGPLAVWGAYGHYAVSAFIAISGFSLALGVAKSGKPLRLRTFAYRRARRILPTYYAALLLSLLVALLVLGTHIGADNGIAAPITRDTLLSHLLLVQDWWPAWQNFAIDPPAWSIAVEWQLYFLFPLLIIAMRRIGAPIALLVAAAAFLATIPLTHTLLTTPGDVQYIWLGVRQLVAYLALFALGAFAAWAAVSPKSVWVRLRRVVPWWLLCALCAGALLVDFYRAGAAAPFFIPNDVLADGLTGGAVLAAFVAAASAPRGIVARVLGWRPLAQVGAFSYSIYLVHFPILALLYVKLVAPHLIGAWHLSPLATLGLLCVGAAPLCIAGAYLFSLVCERPFLVKHT